jgi:hypothetical protein
VDWTIQEAVLCGVPLRILAALPLDRHADRFAPSDALYGAIRESAEKALQDVAEDAELTVHGTTGPTAKGLGSITRYIATPARCPVVITPGETPVPRHQIVAGVRDLDDSETQLAFAFETFCGTSRRQKAPRDRSGHRWGN